MLRLMTPRALRLPAFPCILATFWVAPLSAQPAPDQEVGAQPEPGAPAAPPAAISVEVPAADTPDEPPPEPAAPPPAPPPSQAAPSLVPKLHLDEGVSATRDSGLRERGELGLELDLGMNLRLGSAAGFPREVTLGAVYGGALWIHAFEKASLGLGVQHAELGRGTAESGANLISVEFAATTAWLLGRLVPFRTRNVDGFVTLRAGLAIEHIDADGVRQAGASLDPPRSFSCNEVAGPGMAFGGGIGARFALGPRASLITRLDGNAHQLRGDVISGCALGVGSTTSVSFGLGVAYDFNPAPTGENGQNAAPASETRRGARRGSSALLR